jgi:hypothetical protein
MLKFDVYPKEGAMFTVEMTSFELQDDKFVLFDEGRKPSSEGFLSFDAVAAIIPQTQRGKNVICFDIRLKGFEKPAQVFATAFDLSNGVTVRFLYRQHDIMGKVANEWPVENIYVALSEVVAIVPADGLKYRQW